MKSRRLKAASSRPASRQLTKSCSMRGSDFSASAPQAPGSTGTARQPPAEREPRLPGLQRIARVKHETGGEALGELDAGLGGHRPEEPLGPLQQQPAAVAGLAVGSDRAAVSEADQGADRGANQPVARRIVQARDQAEAATVALVVLFIESGGRDMHGEGLADPPGAGRSQAAAHGPR